MRRNLIWSVAALVFWAMYVPVVCAQESWTHPRIISVTGTSEIKVAPDQVTLTLGVDSHDRDLLAAKLNDDQRVQKLLALAHAAGVEAKNIQTSALTMEPEYSDEKIPKFLDYEVSQTVTVTLTDLSKYEGLMTSSLKAGVNRVDGIIFSIADTTKYKEQARIKAVQAAREKANSMAAVLGQTIGKPWEITEEVGFDTTNYLVNVQTRIQQYAPMAPNAEEPTISGGQLSLRATVRASFQLE